MNSKHIYYSIITAFIIVGLYHVFAVGRFNYPEFRLKAGQVSDIDVIAPFSFPVLKSDSQLKQERDDSLAGLSKPYRISEDQLFDAKSKLDKLFIAALDPKSSETPAALKAAIASAGFELQDASITPLLNQRKSTAIYEDMGNRLQSIYKQGIFENIQSDSIQIVQNDKLKESIEVIIYCNNFVF